VVAAGDKDVLGGVTSVDKKDISIVTMTRASKGDYELHREALRELAAHKLPTVVTDGGSGEEFLAYLNAFPHFVVQKAAQAGAFSQIKTSFDAVRSLATPYVLYTEPDKQFFFEQRLSAFIKQAPKQGSAIILPGRTEESLTSYPESQRFTETFTNQLCGRIVGGAGDFCYGPLLIQRELITCLDLLAEDIGWGWRPFLLGVAHRLKLGVCHIAMDLPCPVEQRADSEAELFHRMRQLQQNVRGLNLAIALTQAQLADLSNSVKREDA
jgi:hypothetical protein